MADRKISELDQKAVDSGDFFVTQNGTENFKSNGEQILTYVEDNIEIEIEDVNQLQQALDGKAGVDHTHTIADVTGLQGVLDTKYDSTTAGVNGQTVFIGGNSVIVPSALGGVEDDRIPATVTVGNLLQFTTEAGGIGEITPQQMEVLLGINNVDNTSDLDKPLSTAQIAALLNKLNKPSGDPTEPSVVQVDTAGNVTYVAVSSLGGGGTGSGNTNLGVTATTDDVTITSDTGTDATIEEASGTQAGVMTAFDKTKLDAIEPLADVTDTDNVFAALSISDSGSTTSVLSQRGVFVPQQDGGTINITGDNLNVQLTDTNQLVPPLAIAVIDNTEAYLNTTDQAISANLSSSFPSTAWLDVSGGGVGIEVVTSFPETAQVNDVVVLTINITGFTAGIYRYDGTTWIEVSAQQVQADWEETDTLATSYIRNKPDLSGVDFYSTWESTQTLEGEGTHSNVVSELAVDEVVKLGISAHHSRDPQQIGGSTAFRNNNWQYYTTTLTAGGFPAIEDPDSPGWRLYFVDFLQVAGIVDDFRDNTAIQPGTSYTQGSQQSFGQGDFSFTSAFGTTLTFRQVIVNEDGDLDFLLFHDFAENSNEPGDLQLRFTNATNIQNPTDGDIVIVNGTNRKRYEALNPVELTFDLDTANTEFNQQPVVFTINEPTKPTNYANLLALTIRTVYGVTTTPLVEEDFVANHRYTFHSGHQNVGYFFDFVGDIDLDSDGMLRIDGVVADQAWSFNIFDSPGSIFDGLLRVTRVGADDGSYGGTNVEIGRRGHSFNIDTGRNANLNQSISVAEVDDNDENSNFEISQVTAGIIGSDVQPSVYSVFRGSNQVGTFTSHVTSTEDSDLNSVVSQVTTIINNQSNTDATSNGNVITMVGGHSETQQEQFSVTVDNGTLVDDNIGDITVDTTSFGATKTTRTSLHTPLVVTNLPTTVPTIEGQLYRSGNNVLVTTSGHEEPRTISSMSTPVVDFGVNGGVVDLTVGGGGGAQFTLEIVNVSPSGWINNSALGAMMGTIQGNEAFVTTVRIGPGVLLGDSTFQIRATNIDDSSNVITSDVITQTVPLGIIESVVLSQEVFGLTEAATVTVTGLPGTPITLSLQEVTPAGWITSGAFQNTSGVIGNDGTFQTVIIVPAGVGDTETRTFRVRAEWTENPLGQATSSVITQNHVQTTEEGDTSANLDFLGSSTGFGATINILTGDPGFDIDVFFTNDDGDLQDLAPIYGAFGLAIPQNNPLGPVVIPTISGLPSSIGFFPPQDITFRVTDDDGDVVNLTTTWTG